MKKVKAKWIIKLGDEKGGVLVEAGKAVKRGEVVIRAETKAPVSGQVVEVTTERVVIEFEAYEIEGQGVTAKKAWGEGLVEVKKLVDITKEVRGKVIYMSEIEGAMILKAEVVGVAAILTTGEVDGGESKLPIVSLDKGAVASLLVMTDIGGRQLLVNANVGRVLVV